MSLDLELRPKECETCGHEPEGQSFNITYNCAKMWHAIYPDDDHMVPIDGMTGDEAFPIIKHAIEVMNKNPKKFRDLNPSNGWGSSVGFRKFLTELAMACVNEPEAVWVSCR